MTDLDKLLQMDSADNISDELLAAYIDGNTTAEENEMIKASMPIEDLNDIAELSQDSLSFEEQLHLYDGDYGYWELGIAPVLDINNSNNHINDIDMERDIYYASAQFGEQPLIDVSGEVYQWYNDTCAIRSQQLVLERFGIEVPQEMLIEIAENNGWYHVDGGSGTPMNCIGNLLEYYGVPSTSVVGANVGNLVAELAQGHQVIVGVDSGELHNGAIMESLKDFFLGDTPDHALIVAGIDLTDPDNAYVVLKDPGTGDVAKPYPLEQFMDAWKDSNCFMVSTDIPTPDYELFQNSLSSIDGVSMNDFLAANNIHDFPSVSLDMSEYGQINDADNIDNDNLDGDYSDNDDTEGVNINFNADDYGTNDVDINDELETESPTDDDMDFDDIMETDL